MALAAGGNHTCALTASGEVKCWGYIYGNISNDTKEYRSRLVDISGVTALTAGEYHTCALTSSGGVKCWNERSDSKSVDIIELRGGVTALAAGWEHICALTASGGVKCWGYNNNGQLGDGTTHQHSTPVNVIQGVH